MDAGQQPGTLDNDQLTGTVLDGRYRLGARLGTGGMSTVYEGWDVNLDRRVAIKVLHASLLVSETNRQRFLREARAISLLNHPGILKVYSYGRCGGRDYIAMDLITGQGLDAYLKARGVLDVDASVGIVMEAAEALQHAHENGIVHRDVKPSNIMLMERDGKRLIQIVDFGVAKSLDAQPQKLTSTNALVGTPYYMSPEQCASQPIDARSDVYSLGCVLFQLLTGRVPFEGDSAYAVALAHMHEAVPALPPHVPPWLANIVACAMSKKPSTRFQTMRDFAEALKKREFMAPLEQATVRPTKAPPRWQPASISALFLLVAGLGGGWWLWQKEPPKAEVLLPARPAPRKDPHADKGLLKAMAEMAAKSDLEAAAKFQKQNQYPSAQVHLYEARLHMQPFQSSGGEVIDRIEAMSKQLADGDGNRIPEWLAAAQSLQSEAATKTTLKEQQSILENAYREWNEVHRLHAKLGQTTAAAYEALLWQLQSVYEQTGNVPACINIEAQLCGFEHEYRPDTGFEAEACGRFAADANQKGDKRCPAVANRAYSLLTNVNQSKVPPEQQIHYAVAAAKVGPYLAGAGMPDKGALCLEKAAALYRQGGLVKNAVDLQYQIGFAHVLAHKPQGIDEMQSYTEGIESGGNFRLAMQLYTNNGNLAKDIDRKRALLCFRKAIECGNRVQRCGDWGDFISQAHSGLALIYAFDHKKEAAEKEAKTAEQIAVRYKANPANVARTLLLRAQVEAALAGRAPQ